MICRRLPWRRRTLRAQGQLQETRERLRAVHDDWAPLGRHLSRIEREIKLNDWTATARRVFTGGSDR